MQRTVFTWRTRSMTMDSSTRDAYPLRVADGAYWVQDGCIYGRSGYTGYWVQEDHVYGPSGYTGYWFEAGRIYGPHGYTSCGVQEGCMYGSLTNLPWGQKR